MQLSLIATPAAPAAAPAAGPTINPKLSWFGEVKRAPFTHPISLKYGPLVSHHSTLEDAVAAAKLLSAGEAPAAVATEELFAWDGDKSVAPKPEDRFSVYSVEYDQWKASRGGTLEESGPYHHGDFKFTRGYELQADSYSDGSRHEAEVLVDGDLTWSNGITPNS
jgi:hypothetical protein